MQNKKTFILAEGAVMVALATVLSYIRIFRLPWGGSVTLLSMLPIVFFSIRRGVKSGLAVSLLYSLVQFFQAVMDGLFGWGLTPVILAACIFLDYIFAFTVLGLAGIFRKGGVAGYMAGTGLAVFLRFICHFLSGFAIWHSFGELWTGFSTDNSVVYSLIYNGAYMLPELMLTSLGAGLLFGSSQIKRLLKIEV